jgi:hypothetical protein
MQRRHLADAARTPDRAMITRTGFTRTGEHHVTRFLRAVAAVALAAVATLAVGASVAPSAASAAPSGDGYVRLAHLSPDTPDVDVYLDSLSHKMKEMVFPGVGYGTVSSYLTLPSGTYAVSMRAKGAKPSTKPILTLNVPVQSGHAYTVAGVGSHADLGLRIIHDDLTSPLNGTATVRVVQASIQAPVLNVQIEGGSTIAKNVAFATTTSYRSVKPGKLTLQVGPPGGTMVPLPVTLHADSVYSILVLDGQSSLKAQLRLDATRNGVVPAGPVETGLGGTSPSYRIIVPAIVLAGAALAGAAALLIRRRPQDRWTSRRQPARTL